MPEDKYFRSPRSAVDRGVDEDVRPYLVGGRLTLPSSIINYPTAWHISRVAELESLGNLRTINGGLYIKDCPNLASLGDLIAINGPLVIERCFRLTDIGALKEVVGWVDLGSTSVETVSPKLAVTQLIPQIPAMTITSFFGPARTIP